LGPIGAPQGRPLGAGLGPLESLVEHGGTRARCAHVVAEGYRSEYEQLFRPLPDVSGVLRAAGPVADAAAAMAWKRLSDAQRDAVMAVYVNIGKFAAYERRFRSARRASTATWRRWRTTAARRGGS
jgi:hypothetical protein